MGHLVVLALLLSMSLGAAAPAPAPLSRSGYATLLGRLRGLVLQGLRPGLSPSQGAMVASRAATLLRAVPPVIVAGRQRMVPDNSPLRADLAARPPRFATALGRLDALLAALREQGSGSTASLPDDQATLAAVFRQPPFVGAPDVGLWDILRSRVSDWLGGLLHSAGLDALPSGLQRLLTIGLVILSAAVVALVIVGASRGLFRSFTPTSTVSADPLSPDAGLDAAAARQKAEAATARGDHREGVRYLFLSTLLHLDARQVLRFDPTGSTRDFVRQARAYDAGIGDLLAQAACLFETMWYGHQPCGPPDYAIMRGLTDRLFSTASTGRAETPQRLEQVG